MIGYLHRKIHNLMHPLLGRILMLHRVVEHRSDKPEQRELEVTPDWLEQKILEYKSQGYKFISIDDIPKLSTFHFPLSTFICLTFDDGYRDNYTTALPLLKHLNVPFAIYITTGFIDNKLPMWWYEGEQLGLNTEELKKLDADPLCTIGAHTISHPKLDSLTFDEQKKEIIDSKTALEQWLGHTIDHFSYPHGAYNDDTIAIVHEGSFRTALMAWGGTVRLGDDPFLLHRIELIQP